MKELLGKGLITLIGLIGKSYEFQSRLVNID
jgi:hypothetical protein